MLLHISYLKTASAPKNKSVAGRGCEKIKTDVELFARLVLCVYFPQLLKRGCGERCGGGCAIT